MRPLVKQDLDQAKQDEWAASWPRLADSNMDRLAPSSASQQANKSAKPIIRSNNHWSTQEGHTTNRISWRHQKASGDGTVQQQQTAMYKNNTSTLASQLSASCNSSPKQQQQQQRKQQLRAQIFTSRSMTSSRMILPLIFASIWLATSLLIIVSAESADGVAPTPSSGTSFKQQMAQSAIGEHSGKSEQSIVASLSSAVASAAAAAAVAAAQAHSLSAGTDARSLSANNAANNHQQHQAHTQGHHRGLGLAVKLVDTIPEVPYSILHNMKKLDHAAPFYNVQSAPKLVVGKEWASAGAMLGSSLMSAAASGSAPGGRLGGVAAEQLGNFLRSPIWKRLADGYDGFASEFRSLFSAPVNSGGHSSGSPTKATGASSSPVALGKLIRDISVPALLVLLASSLSGSELRPVRTRRKSLAPQVELPLNMAPQASQPAQQRPSWIQQQQQQQNYPEHTSINGFELAHGAQQAQQQHQQLRPADINLQQGEATNWMAASSVGGNGGHLQQEAPMLRQPSGQMSLELQQKQQQLGGNLSPAAAELIAHFHSATAANSLQQPVEPQQLTLAAAAASAAAAQEQQQQLNPMRQFARRSDAHLATSLAGDLPPPMLPHKQQQHQIKLLDPTFARRLLEEHANAPSEQLGYSMLGDHRPQALHSILGVKQFSAAAKRLLSGSGGLVSFGDATSEAQRRQAAGAEQRDLTKLLPEAWRQVVKRTMSSVQQQANAQWKVVEGQLAGWVQDKLKSVAASSQAAASAPSAMTSSAGGAPGAPNVSSLIASVSSTALNILGLNKQQQPQTAASAANMERASGGAQAESGSSGKPSELSGGAAAATKPQQPARAGSLANVASLLVQTIKSSTAPSKSNDSSHQKGAEQAPVASHYPTESAASTAANEAHARPASSTSATPAT